MRRERFQQIDRALDAVLERPLEERLDALAEACGADAELRREVEKLLAADEEGEDFLVRPLDGDAVARVLEGLAPLDPGTDGFSEEDELRLGYHLKEVLGQGGAAVVYRAVSQDDGREVAVKVSRRSWKLAHTRRFEAEREILARLSHPGIARFLDGGVTDDGRPYLVMEYVDGEPIDRYCDRRQLAVGDRLRLFCDVCSAVGHAHGEGVVHRDLKPPNVLVSSGGPTAPSRTAPGRTAPGRVKLLDFGIAKLLEPERFDIDFSGTGSGHRLLTPGYASPEQIDCEEVTPASDVYSLGVLLFELLAGRSPYRFDNPWPLPLQVSEAVCERPPSTLAEALDDLADEPESAREVCRTRRVEDLRELRRRLARLERVVAKALEKSPRRRYRSAAALAKALGCGRRGMWRRLCELDFRPSNW